MNPTFAFWIILLCVSFSVTWQKTFKHRKEVSKKRFNGIKVNPVERPLVIGSYNVQTLSKRKFADVRIMTNLEKIVHSYDLILITELMTNNMQIIGRFLDDVNRFAPPGVVYNLIMNNDTVTNEYCAFFYRIDKLKVLKVDTYNDPNRLYRTPYFVLFESPTLRDMSRFGVIGFHVKPTQAVQEINALADVYDFMSEKHKIEDILLMGDFNAACAYVKENDWDNIALWTRTEFTWPIGNHVDTTTNYKSCALDRFVYAGENMNSGVIMTSARAVDLQNEYDFTLEEARALSDHKPIELKIRGKLSGLSEKHLTSDMCFTVQDSRHPNASKTDVMKVGQLAHYTVQGMPQGVAHMKNVTKYLEDMIGALNKLRALLPNVLTQEQVEAVLYKIEEGALEDKSSYADEQHVLYTIDYQILANHTKLLICKTSTIN